jgi:hypothetical protein
LQLLYDEKINDDRKNKDFYSKDLREYETRLRKSESIIIKLKNQ